MVKFNKFLLIIYVALVQSVEEIEERTLVLVPHGENPNNSHNRMVFSIDSNGRHPLLPCLIGNNEVYEHSETFTKGNFHYDCQNGTAQVVACVSEDKSVIQIGRTFLHNGIRHKCIVEGDNVKYEQQSTCFENGIHYNIGDSYRKKSFKVICNENGIAIQGLLSFKKNENHLDLGCFVQNSLTDVIPVGGSKIIGNNKHNCELLDGNKIRYIINLLGCKKENEIYKEGQIWTDKHIRFQCTDERTTKVLGCIDEQGMFIELGRDILIDGNVHRCYKVKDTTIYHRFQCDKEKTIQECLSNASVPQRVIRSARHTNNNIFLIYKNK